MELYIKEPVTLHTANKYCKEDIDLKVETEELSITPTTENQSFEGLYNQVQVKGVTSDIDSNIVPENIKKDVTILGVTGTHEGGGAGEVKLFATKEEMRTDNTAQEGDLAIVYNENATTNFTPTAETQVVTFPSTIILPTQVETETILTGTDNTLITLSSSNFQFRPNMPEDILLINLPFDTSQHPDFIIIFNNNNGRYQVAYPTVDYQTPFYYYATEEEMNGHGFEYWAKDDTERIPIGLTNDNNLKWNYYNLELDATEWNAMATSSGNQVKTSNSSIEYGELLYSSVDILDINGNVYYKAQPYATYSSVDGINYSLTVNSTSQITLDTTFSITDTENWKDEIGYFIQIEQNSPLELYEYNGIEWVFVPTQNNTPFQGIKQFSTEAEMNADTTAEEGNLAVVYRAGTGNINANSQIHSITFPETVALPEEVTSNSVSYLGPVEDYIRLDGEIDLRPSYCRIIIETDSATCNVFYNSSDGINYVRTDGEEIFEIGTLAYLSSLETWNENMGYFMQVSTDYFGGLFRYDGGAWGLAPTQLTANAHYIYQRSYYSEYGVETGTLDKTENLNGFELAMRMSIWDKFSRLQCSETFLYGACHDWKMRSIPPIDITMATDISYMFVNCINLESVPQLDISNVIYFWNMFQNCPKLTDESLNNIMAMCINVRNPWDTTLLYVGLSSEQATRCQSLPNYQALLDAGWTTGY